MYNSLTSVSFFCYFMLVIQLKKSKQKFGWNALTALYSFISQLFMLCRTELEMVLSARNLNVYDT